MAAVIPSGQVSRALTVPKVRAPNVEVATGTSGVTGTAAGAAQVTERVASTGTGLFDTRCVRRMTSDASHAVVVVPAGSRTGSVNSTRTADGGSAGSATVSGTTTRAT